MSNMFTFGKPSDLCALRGKLLYTSERGQRTILLNVESFWGTLIYPKGERFSKTSPCYEKNIGRAFGKRRTSQSWTKIYSNANSLLSMYINYVTLLLQGSTRAFRTKACNSWYCVMANAPWICFHKLSEFPFLNGHRIVPWTFSKDNFSA